LQAFLPEALNRTLQMTDVLGAAEIAAKVGFMAFYGLYLVRPQG